MDSMNVSLFGKEMIFSVGVCIELNALILLNFV